MKKFTYLLLLPIVLLTVSGCMSGKPEPVKVGFICNHPGQVWAIARDGVKKAEKDYNVKCFVYIPPNAKISEQQAALKKFMDRKVSGIAICPIDPEKQRKELNALAEKVNLLCQNTDLPGGKQLGYIGSDNLEAGKMAARAMVKALGGKGKVIIFSGVMTGNAKRRFEGVKDVFKGKKIKIVDVVLDHGNPKQARKNVEKALREHPDTNGMIGLWSYNGPAIMGALKSLKIKPGKIKVVCFDESYDIFRGLLDNYIYATVIEDNYEFGYHSVKLLAEIARGRDPKSLIPDCGKIYIPVRLIQKDSVQKSWKVLRNHYK